MGLAMVGQGTWENLRASPEHSRWSWIIIQESKARESSEESLQAVTVFEFQNSYLRIHSWLLLEIGNICLPYTHTEDNYELSTIQSNPTKPTQFNIARYNTTQWTQQPKLERECVYTYVGACLCVNEPYYGCMLLILGGDFYYQKIVTFLIKSSFLQGTRKKL